MDGAHEALVDQLPLRPYIERGRIAHRFHDIGRVLVEEDAAAKLGSDAGSARNRIVVEAMHRAARAALANDVDRRLLDALPFELHVNSRALSDAREDLLQARNENAWRELDTRHFGPCHLGERAIGPRRPRAPHFRIVMHDGDAVRGEVHVQLDGIGAEIDGTLERGQRILRELAWRATVADALDAPSCVAIGSIFTAAPVMRKACSDAG